MSDQVLSLDSKFFVYNTLLSASNQELRELAKVVESCISLKDLRKAVKENSFFKVFYNSLNKIEKGNLDDLNFLGYSKFMRFLKTHVVEEILYRIAHDIFDLRDYRFAPSCRPEEFIDPDVEVLKP